MSTHLNGLSGKLVGRALRPSGAAVRTSARYSARRVARQTAQPQQNRRRQTDAVATATMADEKPKVRSGVGFLYWVYLMCVCGRFTDESGKTKKPPVRLIRQRLENYKPGKLHKRALRLTALAN